MISHQNLGQNFLAGVTRQLQELSGFGNPHGIPPLEPVYSFTIPSASSKIFHVLFMRDSGGPWDGWVPSPSPARQQEFDAAAMSLVLAQQSFEVQCAHSWVKWAALEMGT